MPSQTPASFASAAASGMNQEAGSRGFGRGEGAVMDWSRPRTNGVGTATFRRPSLATSNSQSSLNQTNNSAAPYNPGTYVPPHHYQNSSARNGSVAESRFSKEQLLGLYKSQKDAGDLGKNVADLFVGGWTPGGLGLGSGPTWNKREDNAKENGPNVDICWEAGGDVVPLGLTELTEQEKEHFSVSVNSTLKPPLQSASKEQNASGMSISRKPSISQGHNSGSPYGLSSPTSARPTTRRRDTSESIPQSSNPLSSPVGGGRATKEAGVTQTPPPLLLRRRTDIRESPSLSARIDRERDPSARDSSAESSTSFPNFLRRNVTIGVGAPTGTSSTIWAAPVGGLSPMGSFGNFGSVDMSGQPPTPGEKRSTTAIPSGASRWSKFMGKGQVEEDVTTDKVSIRTLGKLSEADVDPPSRGWGEARAMRPLSSNTDPFGEEDAPSGSASLGGAQEISVARPGQNTGRGTPTVQEVRDSFGFAEMSNPSHIPRLREMIPDTENEGRPGSSRQDVSAEVEPLSPTETNPYHSPVHEKADPEDIDTDDSDIQDLHHPGLSGMSEEAGQYGMALRGMSSFDKSLAERSQTSSAGPSRGFPGLGGLGSLAGLGGLSGWQAGAASISTPDREKAGFAGGFGNSLFGPMGELQSPNLAGFGGVLPGAGPGTGLPNRGNRLGSLLPTAMQPQMQQGEPSRVMNDAPIDHNEGQAQRPSVDSSTRSVFDPLGTNFTAVGADTASPSRLSRGLFDDILPPNFEAVRNKRSTDSSLASNDPNALAFGSLLQSESMQTPLSAAPAKGQQIVMPSPRNISQPGKQQSQTTASTASLATQIPPTQQRTMVMPDRMRWIYRDPQGNIQGPWSGLEMHDWFKAGFFSAELLVKKYEDPEFEPLGQLIRRIGNSREPFLVPQIGIPHGPATNQTMTTWNAGAGNATPSQPGAQAGSVQPPFAGAFPSFGTTLTAEQQNALERRKQEEQFLMARQKEYLAQQQVLQKQMQQMQGVGVHSQQLHHHSSAHSLHSQPSFGSMGSPATFHQTPPQGPIQPPQPVPGFFDIPMRQNVPPYLGPLAPGNDFSAGNLREDELATLLARQSLGREGQPQMGGAVYPFSQQQQQQENQSHQQHVAALLAQRAQLQREQARQDATQLLGQEEQPGSNERLQQFHELRARLDTEYGQRHEGTAGTQAVPQRATQEEQPTGQLNFQQRLQQSQYGSGDREPSTEAGQESTPFTAPSSQPEPEVLSLTQQVQKAASAKQPAVAAPQPESPWSKVERPGLPNPFPPPPQPMSPLLAPAAQRSRQNLPDALTVEQEAKLRSQTSSVETPSAVSSLAPWAREASDTQRGPTLKEIQEAEARKAAKAEEAAAAARRAALEQERLNQQATAVPVPGLPGSATWGSGNSPVTPTTGGPSAWSKPLAGKTGAGAVESSAKKTLSQIQKEEEEAARKRNAAAAASNVVSNSAGGVSAGKRYADFAGKPPANQTQGGAGAWTTVGAGGKVKTPSGPAIAMPTASRIGGSVNVSTAAPDPKAKPNAPLTKSTAYSGPSSQSQSNAHEEFTKWAKSALAKGLNSNINVDDFVQQLLTFPPEAEIISESVYANSQTMDGRRFADEFLRRRKLADKGIVDTTSSASSARAFSAASTGGESKSAGGWNEVAKKGPVAAKEADGPSAFKMVAAKKKGRK